MVRTWAGAARIPLAQSLDELVKLEEAWPADPALNRPLRMRALELAGDSSFDSVLEIVRRHPSLQPALVPVILGAGAEPLVRAVLASDSDETRLTAARYLATLGQTSPDTVAEEYVSALRFSTATRRLPWSGGALYVPGIAWRPETARPVLRELIAWMIWCDLRDRHDAIAQIQNALSSVGLAATAGYSPPGFGAVVEWLRGWSNIAGKDDLRALLKAQQAHDRLPYRACSMKTHDRPCRRGPKTAGLRRADAFR